MCGLFTEQNPKCLIVAHEPKSEVNNETGLDLGVSQTIHTIQWKGIVAQLIPYKMTYKMIIKFLNLYWIQLLKENVFFGPNLLLHLINKLLPITSQGSVYNSSHSCGRRVSTRHTFHPNMSLIGLNP